MKSELRYKIDGEYHKILNSYGANVSLALQQAGLPGDYLDQAEPSMTITQYYSFINAIGEQGSKAHIALDMARSEQALKFSPEIYAIYFSKNSRILIRRISMYKQTQGAVRYLVDETQENIKIEFLLADGSQLPPFLAMFEIIFVLRLIRDATGKKVIPAEICMREPEEYAELEEILGTDIKKGDTDHILFSAYDMNIPFREHDDIPWQKYEADILRKVYGLTEKGRYSREVQCALIKLMPTGSANLGDVVKEIKISRRTLQRKLLEENTSYREQLNDIRHKIAVYYMKNTEYSVETIAYLLGYTEHNSFIRSFKSWTGMTTREYKKKNIEKNKTKE